MKTYGTGNGQHRNECCDTRNGCCGRKAHKTRDRVLKKRARQFARKQVQEELR